MFGWLKSIFGSEPVQDSVVVPPLPKEKKTVKKADKPAVKKPTTKVKVVKDSVVKTEPNAPKKSKKKEEPKDPPFVYSPPKVELVPVVKPAEEPVSKKKGGRPKKNNA